MPHHEKQRSLPPRQALPWMVPNSKFSSPKANKSRWFRPRDAREREGGMGAAEGTEDRGIWAIVIEEEKAAGDS